MTLDETKRNWDKLGRLDAMWAIVSNPDKKGNKWDSEEFFASGERDIDWTLKRITDLGFPLRLGTALDFGCGIGRLTQALGRHFNKCYGVDIAPSMIALANRYNQRASAVSYLLNDKPDLSLFPDRQFDFVFSHIVLQHIEPQYIRQYLAEFVRVLAPGGLAAFQMPSHLKTSQPEVMTPTPPPEKPGLFAKMRTWLPENKNKLSPTPRQTSAPQDIQVSQNADHDGPEPLEPLISMYTLPREEVLSIITASGGRMVRIEDDDSCGDECCSYKYWATRG